MNSAHVTQARPDSSLGFQVIPENLVSGSLPARQQSPEELFQGAVLHRLHQPRPQVPHLPNGTFNHPLTAAMHPYRGTKGFSPLKDFSRTASTAPSRDNKPPLKWIWSPLLITAWPEFVSYLGEYVSRFQAERTACATSRQRGPPQRAPSETFGTHTWRRG